MAAADADEATTALIAKLLAEDNPYADDGGGYHGVDDDSGSDFDAAGKAKKRRKKTGGKATAAKPKQAKGQAAGGSGGDGEAEFTASGRRKRKDTGVKRESGPKAWTEEEERLFLEALKQYGRNWKQAAVHVGTRDARAITSHAQKWFIKMCLQGRPLPSKVRESGDGYTLSGKPLDPNSAAARAYGFKPDSMQKLMESTGGVALPGVMETKETEGEGAEHQEIAASTATDSAVVDDPASASASASASATPPVAAASKRAKATKSKPPPPPPPPPGDGTPPPPSEYLLNRPRREAKAMGFRSSDGTFELTPCCAFSCVAGSSAAQPFVVTVAPAVRLMMDLHAHLCSNEVIGFLGGTVDAVARTISIERVFPGRGQASGWDVEMDAVAEVEMRSEVAAAGMSVVGWYHSHPVFAPNPSGTDINNQINYQTLFRDNTTGWEPFVAFIVGSYDLRLPGPHSKLQAFVVRTQQGQPTPFEVTFGAPVEEAPLGDDTLQAVRRLVESQKGVEKRVDLTELWRPFTYMAADGTASGGPVTKLAKLRASLRVHLPTEGETADAAEDLMDEVAKSIQSSWAVDLGY